MKTNTKKAILLGVILASFAIHVKAQVQYNGCSVTGTYASAIGKNNTASGNNSFAGGYGSQAAGSNSFAFGYNSKTTQSTTTALGNTALATGVGSMAIGNYVKATAQNAFVFGSGTTSSYPLTNSTDNSIAFGVNSNKPTLLITKSLNNNYTGKVAIGQVTNPQAKLHIKSDSNEDAGVFLEPANTNAYKAFIKLFDNNHSIMVDKTGTMELSSNNSMAFNSSNSLDLQSGKITLTGKIGINTINNTNGYALAVDGGIVSSKVYIKEVKLWPDYVFRDDYELMDWDELRAYLNEKRHLPGIPEEDEILQNGYDLSDMQTLMLEKIEELTRYILLLQEEMDGLKSKVALGDSIVFGYDSNGNRISRSLLFQKVVSPEETGQTSLVDSYELFPNPTPGMFTVLIKEQSQDISLHAKLLTLNGAILNETDIDANPATFDLSGQPEGIYLLEIDGPDGHQTWKVIKR